MGGRDIAINGAGGTFTGYLEAPTSGAGPGIVIIQEIFGINPWIREVTQWYAAQGYFALAPDLFWRMKPGVQLDPMNDAELRLAFGYYEKFDVEKGVTDIQASIDALRHVSGCTGKVGHLGFCLGGLLAYLAAARTNSDACASYYGGGIEGKLNEMDAIKAPTILHLAGNDDYVPQAAIDSIVASARRNPRVAIHVYPGMPHAFCRAHDPRHFNPEACDLAHRRSLELFAVALA